MHVPAIIPSPSELFSATAAWAEAFPSTAEYLDGLVKGGVRCGIFSSLLASLVAVEHGLTIIRPPDDVDLLVAGEDFALAIALSRGMPTEIERDKLIRGVTADGLDLRMRADNAVVKTGETSVQFMRPLTSLRCGPDHEYNTNFGDWAFSYTTHIETPQGTIPQAHPLLTQVFYGILQREGEKNDEQNTAVLQGVIPPDGVFARRCDEEMLLNERVWRYIHGAGRVQGSTPPTLVEAAPL